jgi:ankyrin repeat protein
MLVGYSESPLEVALRKTNFDIAKILLENGANINYFNKEMGENDSILTWSVKYGNPDIVRFLLENGVDVNYKNANGKKAVELAKENGNAEILELLNEYPD